MLVPDLLHEFELGVWKGLFTHLIRVLYAAAPDGSLVAELNRRCDHYFDSYHILICQSSSFRDMPTFGSSTIRRFASNASEMKKLAARDFEDLLQVSDMIFAISGSDCAQNATFSAVFLPSKDFFQNPIIHWSEHYCTALQNGMHLPNFGCIPRAPSTTSRSLRQD
jgi:hypothetical protein